MTGPMATRLAGSSDLYQPSGRRPYHSINFVTSHDGFTLNDLVSYERKHNPTTARTTATATTTTTAPTTASKARRAARASTDLRQRQMKNMLASLLLSQGVPMILSGDEVLRTQRGNNNAYCQDNAIRWFDWRLVEKNAEMLRFVASADRVPPPAAERAPRVVPHRQGHQAGPVAGRELVRPSGKPVDWNAVGPSLTSVFGTSGLDDPAARPVMIMLHAGGEPQPFVVPPAVASIAWRSVRRHGRRVARRHVPGRRRPAAGPGADCARAHSLRCYVAE